MTRISAKKQKSARRPLFTPSNLLDRASEADIACIKRLDIELRAFPDTSSKVRWHLDIHNAAEVDCHIDESLLSRQLHGLPKGWIDAATTSLGKVLEEMKSREFSHKLRKEDFEVCRSAVGRAMFGQ